MSLTAKLEYLVDQVLAQLGDAAALFPNHDVIERWINEGQARYLPVHLRQRVLQDFDWAVGVTEVELPDDCYSIRRLMPDAASRSAYVPLYEVFDGQINFEEETTDAWNGRLYYNAVWPTVTNTEDCLMPEQCRFGLISYGIYKAYLEIASDRALYRRYATLANTNGITVDDLRQLAETHLRDFEDIRGEAPLPPVTLR